MIPHFPQEILIEILSRLPSKSVGKCKCVSKPWKNLLSDPQFIKSHLTSKTRQENLILITPSHSLRAISTIQIHWFSRNLGFLPDTWADIVGSSNGLVLLNNEEDGKFLVNPITRQMVHVPDSPLSMYEPGSFSMLGFGYDSSDDDYKIVTLSYISADTFVDIYSVKRGVWKRLDSSPNDHRVVPDLASGAFVNGAIHWLASSRKSGYRSVIAAFDLANESFNQMLAPSSVGVDKFLFNSLAVLGGCLCMIDNLERDQIDVWIMKEYGLVDSWTKFSITDDIQRDIVKPLCYVGDGEVVFLTAQENLMVYDSKSGMLRDITVDGLPTMFLDGGTFVDSIVSPVFNNRI